MDVVNGNVMQHPLAPRLFSHHRKENMVHNQKKIKYDKYAFTLMTRKRKGLYCRSQQNSQNDSCGRDWRTCPQGNF